MPLFSLFLRQCRHSVPAVTMTKVGAGLNLVVADCGLLFTVDLVPSLLVKVKSADYNQLKLRQDITRKMLLEKPPSWFDHLAKYFVDDGLFLADFLSDSKPRNGVLCVNMKMINYRGDMILKPGNNSDLSEAISCPGAKDAYVLLKILKKISMGASAKSYEIKKVLADLRRKKGDDFAADVFSCVKEAVRHDELGPVRFGNFWISEKLSPTVGSGVLDLVNFPHAMKSTPDNPMLHFGHSKGQFDRRRIRERLQEPDLSLFRRR